MRTVTVEVPEGHMVKIVKEESMQSTQKVMGGGKFEFEGETFIPGDVIINPNRGGGSMMILSEIREERPLPFLPAIKVPFGLVAYVPSNDEGDRVFVKLTPEAGIGGMKGFRKATEEEKAKMLAAMKEGVGRGVLVKGGRFLESLAAADAVVFDKTGTLTESRPRVAEVIPGEGYERDDILRTAACLEEHFPHPVARAVVRKAEQEGLHHQEEHTEVEYVVAHGIASRLHGKRVLFGSRHYIHHDEGVPVDGMREDIERLAREGRSILYLAVDGKLAGLIAIEDPLRPEAAPVIRKLLGRGIRVVMHRSFKSLRSCLLHWSL